MPPTLIRTIWTALAAVALFVDATQGAMATGAPVAPAPGVAGGPAQQGPAGDPTLEAEFDAEIDAAVAAATGSALPARLRALVNNGRVPQAARTTIALVMERTAQRAAPAALACRRVADGGDAVHDRALVERCQPWIDAHAEGALARAACRRLGTTTALPAGLHSLVERCRTVIATQEPDGTALQDVCSRLAVRDAAADANDALARRCRALNALLLDSGFDDASTLARCVRAARSAAKQTALLYRCLALFSDGGDGGAPGDRSRTLRAELRATVDTNVSAETEGIAIQRVAEVLRMRLAVLQASPARPAPADGATGRLQ